jgi:hypothetical protein
VAMPISLAMYGLFIMVLRVPGQDFGVHPVLVNHVGDQHHFLKKVMLISMASKLASASSLPTTSGLASSVELSSFTRTFFCFSSFSMSQTLCIACKW